MAETLSGNFTSNLSFALASPNGLGTAQFNLNSPSLAACSLIQNLGASLTLSVNQLYTTQLNLVAATPQDIDFYAFGGALDGVGNALTMAFVKGFIIQNLGAASPVETDTVTIGGDSTTAAWTSFLGTNASAFILPSPPSTAATQPPSTLIFLAPGAVGWAVGSSTTNHKLQFTANTHNQKVNLTVFGSTN